MNLYLVIISPGATCTAEDFIASLDEHFLEWSSPLLVPHVVNLLLDDSIGRLVAVEVELNRRLWFTAPSAVKRKCIIGKKMA